MPDRISFGNIELSVRGKKTAQASPENDAPFRILVLGDFTGRASRGIVQPLAGRRCINVDVDTLDAALSRMKPELTVTTDDHTSSAFSFATLDDFHPDYIFRRLPLFQKLRETRDALQNPATAQRATAEVASWGGPPMSPVKKEEDTFARLLGGASAERTARAAAAAGGIHDLIRQIVAPHVVPTPNPNVTAMSAAVDAAIGAQMRDFLHQPAFQALESAWRGLDFLVRNIETDETLTICVLDVSKAELAGDLRGVDDLARSAFFKIVVEETVQSPGGVPWGVIIGDYSFGSAEDDADLLARIGKVAGAGGAPFLGGADAEFVPAASTDAVVANEWWRALRGLPQAESIGLAAPRFLLRLPYGKGGDPIDSFPFEELPDPTTHDSFLWGNPAFVCACLLGESFRQNEWRMTPGDVTELGGLPAHTFELEGETKITPCAERWLTDGQAEKLLGVGIMPLLSIRGRDAVRLLRFQSIADPPVALAGSWD